MSQELIQRPESLSIRLSHDKKWIMVFPKPQIGGKWITKADYVWHLKEGYTDANAPFVRDRDGFIPRAGKASSIKNGS
jgi:hypothetical protein